MQIKRLETKQWLFDLKMSIFCLWRFLSASYEVDVNLWVYISYTICMSMSTHTISSSQMSAQTWAFGMAWQTVGMAWGGRGQAESDPISDCLFRGSGLGSSLGEQAAW